MKKIVIYVSCLLLVVSCSNYEEPLKNVIVEDQGNDIPTLRMAGDGDNDVLGFGYDVAGTYLDPISVKNAVIDISRLKNDYPDKVYYNASTSIYNRYTYGYSAEDYLSEKTKEVSTNAKVGFDTLFSGTFSNNNNFNSKLSLSSLYLYASCDVVKNVKRIYTIADINLLKNYLSPSFAQALNTKSADEIINMYGTHVLADFTIGGRYNFIFRSAANTSLTNTTKKDVVKAGANFTFLKIGVGGDTNVSQTTINQYQNDNKSKELFIKCYGGETTGISYSNLETGYPTINPSTWEASVNKNNAALTEINWDKTIPIWEFALNPTQREALRVAAINHVKNNMIHSYDLLPMIEWVTTGPTNFYFLAGGTDSPYFPNLVKQYPTSYFYNVSNNIAGYMLRNQEDGSKPLYLFISDITSSTVKRFLYTTNRNIQTNYLYLGFLGYVYTEQKPGTSYPFPNKFHPANAVSNQIGGETFYIYTPN